MRSTPFQQALNRAFALIATALLLAYAAAAQGFSINESPLPPPTGFINDYAGVIDAQTKQDLERKLKEFRDTTSPSVEIAVAVVKTTGDRPIFEYSLAVARGWKIGSKEDDNPGALLFVAIDDRKYFTQVSKDLEDELPDGAVGTIQRQYLVPEFKKGNYAKGIADTIDAYISTIRNKGNIPVAPPAATTNKDSNSRDRLITCFCCAAILLFIALALWSDRKKKGPTSQDRDRWGGGGSVVPWIVSSGSGSSSDWGSSSSSDWGSSSSSSDWGGFSGGGDFGGGGSGGDW